MDFELIIQLQGEELTNTLFLVASILVAIIGIFMPSRDKKGSQK